MAFITKKEEGLFLALFNRDGYVLNFNDSTFNAFTASSIGEALKKKYGMSKGKSLAAYLNDATDANRTKILVPLWRKPPGREPTAGVS